MCLLCRTACPDVMDHLLDCFIVMDKHYFNVADGKVEIYVDYVILSSLLYCIIVGDKQ